MDRQLLAVLLANAVRARLSSPLRPAACLAFSGSYLYGLIPSSVYDHEIGDDGMLATAARALVGIHIDALAVQSVGERLADLLVLQRFGCSRFTWSIRNCSACWAEY